MQDLRISLIQTSLFWEDTDANIGLFDRKIDDIGEATDLVVLPEMFTTGFSMNAEEQFHEMNGSSVAWLKQKSRQKGVDITGSMIIRERGRFFNRLLWAKPDGGLLWYDKRHLFRYAGEDAVYSPGEDLLTVELNGWRIRPFICFDLRFPVWTRNAGNCYDAAIFIANWPETRALHWRRLLQSRAIENQCYVIGVNRVGKDGKGLSYSGDSAVIDPMGSFLFQQEHQECVHTATLSHDSLSAYREAFPVWKDADDFALR
jgi:predicted amidohydrolase